MEFMTTETSGESPVIAETNAIATDAPDGATEQAQGAESAPAADTSESPEPTKKVAWWDKRISELTGEKHSERLAREQAEANAEYWRRYALENAPKPEAAKPTIKTLEDFEFDAGKYQSYLLGEVVPDVVAKQVETKLSERDKYEQAQRREAEWNKRSQDFIKETGDFVDVVLRNPALRITDEMGEVIKSSEMGPQVAYYLGKNPVIASNIASLPPVLQAAELGKIEARLEKPKAAEPPKVSKAPPPTPTLAAKEPGPVEKAPSEMTDREFAKWREKQIDARMGRRR